MMLFNMMTKVTVNEVIDSVTDIDVYGAHVTDVEVYYSINGKCDYHTDNLKQAYIGENVMDEEILDYYVMDKETYMETVWSNTSYTAQEFDETFGEDGNILVILIKY